MLSSIPASPAAPPPGLLRDVPLRDRCTLGLGGPARHFVSVGDLDALRAALRWADARGLDVAVLGGGSNVVVADAGFDGLVIHTGQRGVALLPDGGRVLVTAAAGEPWDELVERTVAEGLAGLECLSGIPGLVGATPIQNVGAYGQEVAETIHAVQVMERATLDLRWLSPSTCGFGYRHSRFKEEPGRYVVLAVTFALAPGGAPKRAYDELSRALPEHASLPEVRQAVLSLRRRKSMVLDPDDENRRSVGSFFTNPVLPEAQARAALQRAVDTGAAATADEVPRYPAGPGRIKLAAGWLIERAGIRRGQRHGQAGVSSRHALSLVHHGGGSTAELLELAQAVQQAVHGRFGVWLQAEPAFLGFAAPPLSGSAAEATD